MSEDIDWKELQSKAAAGKEAKVQPQNVLDLLQELRSAEKDRDLARSEINKMKADFNLQSVQLEKLGVDLKKAQKSATSSGELTELRNKIASLEGDNKSKAQFIGQLEKDTMDAKNKLADVQAKASGSAGAEIRVKDLETKLGAKEKEIDEMAERLKAMDSIKADFEKIKADSDAAAGSAAALGKADLEKEKVEFESEKKKLFAEMENFEVSLRMEMEQKDEKLKSLENQVKEMKEQPVVAPSPVMVASTTPSSRPSKESLIAKLGLDNVDMIRKPVPAAKDYAYPGKGFSGEKAEVVTAASGESRIVCPKCSSTSLRIESDRSRVLSYMGGVPMYAKKYVCRKCMYDFRVD